MLTLHTGFIRKYSISNCRLNLTTIRNQQLGPSTTPGYVNASLAYTWDLNSGIHFQELNLTLSRSGLPQPTRWSRPGSRCQTHPCPHSLWTHFKAGKGISHPVPTRPSHFILKDIFEFQHKQYLVTVDHYSDFHELDQLINTQSTTIIVLTKAHFAHHGIPVGFLTDNGPKAKEV